VLRRKQTKLAFAYGIAEEIREFKIMYKLKAVSSQLTAFVFSSNVIDLQYAREFSTFAGSQAGSAS
jgi:hypothetical protein